MFLMVIMYVFSIMLIFFLMNLFLVLLMNNSVLVINYKLFTNGFWGDLEFLFSVWSVLFLFMVVMISLSVVIFSFSYMNGYSVNNFIFLYFSFVVSMMWLIINNNFYWMMFGWDGLGVVSFLLIVFYMNQESVSNGLFTLFQNRLGDLFFVLFMVGILDMSMWNNSVVKGVLLFLVIGSSVKSAQFPFNTWLLAAMSAPTPISSLVHSSTLVVAGVYILLQYSYCLLDVMFILKFISIFTLLVSSFGLLNELDMKKLIAYSTMSHVSLMMFMMSFKLMKVVYFHLNIHAMFKSLMFMCFGFVMLSSFHSQDKRLVSLFNLNPMIKMIYYFSCLCLAGLPMLSAFFSKDFMIEDLMTFNFEFSFIVMLLFFLSISIYYSFKLLQITNVNFSMMCFEKSILGMMSVILMMGVMIFFINIYIAFIFSLSLELMNNKLFIYTMIILLLFLSIFSNFNFKIVSYSKSMNLKEIWSLDFYVLDKFAYWNMFIFLNYVSVMNKVKLYLLMNWWFLILLVMLF